MGRRSIYDVSENLPPEEKKKCRKKLQQRALRRRRAEESKAMKIELSDFRYTFRKAVIDGVTGKELAPSIELSPEELVKVAKFLMEAEIASDPNVLIDRFRQAQRVLIRHNMDFVTLLLGRVIVERSV
jgi:hypothetical protein